MIHPTPKASRNKFENFIPFINKIFASTLSRWSTLNWTTNYVFQGLHFMYKKISNHFTLFDKITITVARHSKSSNNFNKLNVLNVSTILMKSFPIMLIATRHYFIELVHLKSNLDKNIIINRQTVKLLLLFWSNFFV